MNPSCCYYKFSNVTTIYSEGKPFAIYNGANEELVYLHLDYQGSLMAITDQTGDIKENRSYDAWGRPRDPSTWSYNIGMAFGGAGEGITMRGYTMHEHLEMFSLINMNGRLYDPVLGRMLSPDNYIQEPNNTQSYNRYSYCINNPLKYTDPSGNIFGTWFTFGASLVESVVSTGYNFWATGLFRGGFDPTSASARTNAWDSYRAHVSGTWTSFDPTARWSKTNKAAKIDWGLLQTDPNRSILGRGWQLLSRFTWEAPQSGLGNIFSHIRNNLGEVHNVDYWGGATIVNSEHKDDLPWGLTLGSYINSNRMKASPEDGLFRHEYGHTIQSQIAGLTYLTGIGIQSLIGGGLEMAFGEDFHNHNTEWYETNANQLGFAYFNHYEKETLARVPWNFNRYPTNYNPTLYWLFGNPFYSPWTFAIGLFFQR